MASIEIPRPINGDVMHRNTALNHHGFLAYSYCMALLYINHPFRPILLIALRGDAGVAGDVIESSKIPRTINDDVMRRNTALNQCGYLAYSPCIALQ